MAWLLCWRGPSDARSWGLMPCAVSMADAFVSGGASVDARRMTVATTAGAPPSGGVGTDGKRIRVYPDFSEVRLLHGYGLLF
jgi:hypothetical protein